MVVGERTPEGMRHLSVALSLDEPTMTALAHSTLPVVVRTHVGQAHSWMCAFFSLISFVCLFTCLIV